MKAKERSLGKRHRSSALEQLSSAQTYSEECRITQTPLKGNKRAERKGVPGETALRLCRDRRFKWKMTKAFQSMKESSSGDEADLSESCRDVSKEAPASWEEQALKEEEAACSNVSKARKRDWKESCLRSSWR